MLFRKRIQKWHNWFAWYPVMASTDRGLKRVWLLPVRCIWFEPETCEKPYFFYRIFNKHKFESDRTVLFGDHSDLPLSKEGKELASVTAWVIPK